MVPMSPRLHPMRQFKVLEDAFFHEAASDQKVSVFASCRQEAERADAVDADAWSGVLDAHDPFTFLEQIDSFSGEFLLEHDVVEYSLKTFSFVPLKISLWALWE
eukprot:CAMPEP_0117440574 /NCGR_PEP_ID=MMETSP0759-20121206/3167_1 /TAXON_ID=63605 /ORGANISM="Percolomonas cosmopolitus, Strain WS" /LENGTH=103 /DNA_ID=CAMNT_0005232357 /DNA_START=437 /DNA_END=748 /DNA_ORIENTATION=-